ncbi:hypothetical protein SDRG_06534 [Saprolegnia diclina VS20]|uniref:Exocyst complex component n=1 Tax=Saprolegnia diclina (strain VS20) TaxID=1156394 RepID=T0QPJ3_SAPDV|nr:hypothetical protein SDRG_06534 [Saprolegnia diclina VS20]EQC35775.1 hypothetical protein SDRG_06534 [Saprolegnia diclina VS20]|eukprot:XP_008610537.1 hypothetical protein SDRG_06534 [Saprolegnia diclina VS20]
MLERGQRLRARDWLKYTIMTNQSADRAVSSKSLAAARDRPMLPSDDDDFLKETIDPKLDMNSVEFNATAYLAAKHADTKYAGLVAELETLKRSTSDKTEQLKALVASHFDQYLSCHEAIREVSDEIRAHESDSERLTTAFRSLKSTADKTLSLMLQRCEEQRKTRHALAVLARYRSFFEIPARMRASLAKKDYVKLVEDYVHLKAHAGKANMSLLKPVLESATKTATTANDELLHVLRDPDAVYADQKQAIYVVDAFGITPKPSLLCVKTQLADMERILTSLSGPVVPIDSKTRSIKPKDTRSAPAAVVARSSAEIIADCGRLLRRFERGLWPILCDTMALSTLCATEQEALHTSAADVLATCVRHLREQTLYTTNVSAEMVASLHTISLDLDSLGPCPDSVLTAKLDALKAAFCGQVRSDVLLAFFTAVTHAAESRWSTSVEMHGAAWAAAAAALHDSIQYAAQNDRPDVLEAAAGVFDNTLFEWWCTLQPVLTQALETNLALDDAMHAAFCATLLQSVVAHGQTLLSLFGTLLSADVLVDDAPTSLASLVVVANCLAVPRRAGFLAFLNALQDTKVDVRSLSLSSTILECGKRFHDSRVALLCATLDDEESFYVPGSRTEVRPYVFSVLYYLVSWRSHVEFCIRSDTERHVHSLLSQCADTLQHFLAGRAEDATRCASSDEAQWQRTQLHVEASFFKKTLAAFVSTKATAWDSLIKRLASHTSSGEVADLLSQVELQTQMYRLSLMQ